MLESAGDSGSYVVRYANTFQNLSQLLGNLVFPEAWQFALSVIAATAVVNVFSLLELCRYCEVVVRTGHHATEGNVVFAVLSFVVSVDHCLNGFE
jgi:hypothetical protein